VGPSSPSSPALPITLASPSASVSSASGACQCEIRGWSYGAIAIGQTFLLVNPPAGTQPGDILLAFITADTSYDDAGDPNGGSFSPDPSWNLLLRSDYWLYGSDKSLRAFVYWKVAQANEPAAAWSDGVDGIAMTVLETAVGNAGIPAGAIQLTASPNPQAPSTPGAPNGLLFCSFHEFGGAFITQPPGMTDSGLDTAVGDLGTEVSYQFGAVGPTGIRTASVPGVRTMAGASVVLPCCVLASSVSAPSISARSLSLSSSSSYCPCIVRGFVQGYSVETLSILPPPGYQPGDLLLAFITADTTRQDVNPGGGGGAFVPDPSWTLCVKSPPVTWATNFRIRGFVYYKVAGANEPASNWVDNYEISMVMAAIGQAGIPTGVAQITRSDNALAPAVVATAANNLVFASFHELPVNPAVITQPPGFTESGQDTVVNTGGTAVEVSYRQPMVGMVGPFHATVSGPLAFMAGISTVVPCCVGISLSSSPSSPSASSLSALSLSSSFSASFPSSVSLSSSPSPLASLSASPSPSVSSSGPSSAGCQCIIRGWTHDAGTSVSVPVPPGTQAGDIMLTWLTVDQTAGTFTPDPNWTFLATGGAFTALGTTAQGYAYWRVAPASPGPGIWSTTGGADGITALCTSVGQAGAPTGAGQQTNAPNPQAPSLGCGPNSLLFCSFHEIGGIVITPPPGMTDSGLDTSVGDLGTEVSFQQPTPCPTGVRTASVAGTAAMNGISVVLPCCVSPASSPSSPSSSSSSVLLSSPSSPSLSSSPSSPSPSSSAISPSSPSSPLPSLSSSSVVGGTISTGCCAPFLLPAVLHATISAPSCPCIDGVQVTLTFNGVVNSWQSANIPTTCTGNPTLNLQLRCPAGQTACTGFQLIFQCNTSSISTTYNPSPCSCSPLSLTFTGINNNDNIGTPCCRFANIGVTIVP
jgi:hypothetical protein